MLEPGIEVRSLVRPAVFIPESKRLNVLLREFRVSRNHQAIVIDEHGGISGLVTMEDVLEQIVGDIEDEFDETEEDSIFPEGENQWRVRAATEISHFNDVFGSKLPDDEYDSVGGWMGGRLAASAPWRSRRNRRSAHRGRPRRRPPRPLAACATPGRAPFRPQSHRSMSPTPRGRLLRGAAGDTGRRGARPDIRSRPAARLGPGHHPGAGAGRGRARDAVCAVGRLIWARGWLFSFATYALGLYWIFISLHRYGDLAAPLAAAAVLLLSAFLAIFPATACALARRHAPLEPDSPPARALTGARPGPPCGPASNGCARCCSPAFPG